MAAVSMYQHTRQKRNVYGKAGKSSWNGNTNFFDDSGDEVAGPTPAPAAIAKSRQAAQVNASYRVQKKEVKKKPTPPKATKEKDAFDFPSSDEEASPELPVARRPVIKAKATLVDDRTSEKGHLAPWERKRDQSATHSRKIVAAISNSDAADVDTQLHKDLQNAAGAKHILRGARSKIAEKANEEASQPGASPARGAKAGASSAAARLAERKRFSENDLRPLAVAKPQVEASLHKRVALDDSHPIRSPHKRAKTTIDPRETSSDVAMDAYTSPFNCQASSPGKVASNREVDIFDFPDSLADESAKPRQRPASSKIARKQTRRGRLAQVSSKSSPLKGLSAPARLAEMLPMDSDITEATTPSPGASVSRSSTPHRPATPPAGQNASPETARRAHGNMTPKQAQLWDRLLPSQADVASPSALAIRDLTISGERRRTRPDSGLTRTLTKSQSDIPRKKTRLVDRLKASAPATSLESASDESSGDEDVAMHDESETVQHQVVVDEVPVEQTSRPSRPSQSRSQSHSQASATAKAGPRRTYASQRSHLVDDSLDALLDETPKVARTTKTFSKSQSNSQKSAYDPDSSDGDEPGVSRIRTIHELRASGRTIRGAEDIEQLLEDVENHNNAHKSRRRSALVELANKLADSAFAGRFIGQGCELRFARECMACKDDIASFAFAAATTFVLVSSPPDHTVRTLQDHGIVSWLADQLSENRDIAKMAKDRQYNMAKASQNSLIDLGELAKGQQAVWNDALPTTMSLRLMALKTLDLLVGRLRRGGNKSELLVKQQLRAVLPDMDVLVAEEKQSEALVITSVLESLSTTSLLLDWDAATLAKIAQAMPQLISTTPLRRHTMFLMLRLCLNLTTDNPRNCALLATSSSTSFLLKAVLDGFAAIELEQDEDKRTIALDLLVLALGISINMFEHSPDALGYATTSDCQTLLGSLVETFTTGQKRMLDAESVEESISNVAFGYLAVMLANLCQDSKAQAIVAGQLPGKGLGMLVEAVEEFVLHHQQVDKMNFEGEEGKGVWGAFTEKLQRVLQKLRGVDEKNDL